MKRHTWINFPTRNKRKCTRCGITKITGGTGNYSSTIYYKDGKQLPKNPGCK